MFHYAVFREPQRKRFTALASTIESESTPHAMRGDPGPTGIRHVHRRWIVLSERPRSRRITLLSRGSRSRASFHGMTWPGYRPRSADSRSDLGPKIWRLRSPHRAMLGSSPRGARGSDYGGVPANLSRPCSRNCRPCSFGAYVSAIRRSAAPQAQRANSPIRAGPSCQSCPAAGCSPGSSVPSMSMSPLVLQRPT